MIVGLKNGVEFEEDTVDVDFPASMSLNNDEILKEAEKASPVKKAPNLGKDQSAPAEKSSPVKVSLFKKRPPKPLKTSRSKRSKIEIKPANYDSDSIDIDVLATFNAKSFAASTGVSPPGDSSSLDSTTGFSALMKKPLTTAPIVTKDESLSPPTPPSSFNGKITLSNQSEPVVKIQSNTVEDSKGCSNKVNAFSRLMASKGKVQKNKATNGKGAEG